MVSQWVISPTYKWDILGSANPLILTIDPSTSCPGHPSIAVLFGVFIGAKSGRSTPQQSLGQAWGQPIAPTPPRIHGTD